MAETPLAEQAPTSDPSAWYAVWTRSRHEQVVREQLVHKDIETFLPMVSRWSRWKDRRKRIDWPLFPGYCFAHFDAANTLPILTCNGVVRIVSICQTPAAIPDDEINSLRVLMAQQLACDPCPLAAAGTIVDVVSGPLRGVVGRLLSKNSKSATVMLAVDLIGQAVRVEVDAADIEPR
jgi:transcription antitermination factor NusG